MFDKIGSMALRQAMTSCANSIAVPPDTAEHILHGVLLQCGMQANVAFLPQPAAVASASAAPVIAGAAAVAAGAGSAAVMTGALLLSPQIDAIDVPTALTNQPAAISASVSDTVPIEAVYAVDASGSLQYAGEQTEKGQYQLLLPENGTYTVYAVGTNGQTDSAEITVSCVDAQPPSVRDYTYDEEQITIWLDDDLAGVDYDSIYGESENGAYLQPISVDEAAGEVVFAVEEESFHLVVSDLTGNELRSLVSVEWQEHPVDAAEETE